MSLQQPGTTLEPVRAITLEEVRAARERIAGTIVRTPMTTSRHRLFRDRSAHSHSIVTYIELFFDLVFVFAITQLSTRLLDNLTLVGALQTLTLFLAVWWVWIYTSWVTNWLDPERANVRLMLIVMMLGGLALSSGIPDAFGQAGLLFAGAYVAMQVVSQSLHGLGVARRERGAQA